MLWLGGCVVLSLELKNGRKLEKKSRGKIVCRRLTETWRHLPRGHVCQLGLEISNRGQVTLGQRGGGFPKGVYVLRRAFPPLASVFTYSL